METSQKQRRSAYLRGRVMQLATGRQMSMEWKQVGNKAETMWKCRLARQGDALYDRATWRVKWKQVGNMSETTSKCSCAWQGHAVCDRATVTEQVGNKQEQCRSGDLRGSPIDDRATVTVAWKQVGNKSETMSKCSFARTTPFATGPRSGRQGNRLETSQKPCRSTHFS